MASTAKQRLIETDRLDNTLLKRKIFSNGEYKTVEDYLINVYPNEMDFDATRMVEALKARTTEAENRYSELISNLLNGKLADSKYNEPVRKDINQYMSFNEYIKSLPIGTVASFGVVIGGRGVSFDELYDKFSKDVYEEMDQELANLQEPSAEEQELATKQHYIADMFYRIVNERELLEQRDAMLQNNEFVRKLLIEYPTSIPDFEKALVDGSLEKGINEIIDNTIIKEEDHKEVDKMMQSIETPVSQMEEIRVDNFGASTRSTEQLNNGELNALYNGLSYAEQKKIDTIRLSSGPEDDDEEEVDLDGTPQTEVELNDKQPKIRM